MKSMSKIDVPSPGQQSSVRFNIPLDIIWELWNLDWPTRIRVTRYLSNAQVQA